MSTSRTALSVARQVEILNQNWSKLIPKATQQQIRKAKRIVFVGTGSSFHISSWGAWAFSNTKQTWAVASWDFLYRVRTKRWSGTKDDFFIVCSHRGYRSLTKTVVDEIKKRKLGGFVLLGGKTSPSGGFPFIPASPPEISQSHTMSVCGGMAAIAFMAGKHLGKGFPAIAKKVLTGKPVSLPVSKTKRRPIIVLGAAETLPIAREIALKLQETCYLPAAAYPLEDFMHGSFTAIERGDIILHLCSTAGLRASQSLDALRVLGANCVVPPSYIAQLPPVARSFAVLFWGQKLCLRLSVALKTNPDDNRLHDERYRRAKEICEFSQI